MKLNELKRIAEEYGCATKDRGFELAVTHNGRCIATIRTDLPYVVDTNWNTTKRDREFYTPVITAAIQYAMTPIEDRKDTDLYYVKYPKISGLSEMHYGYVNYHVDDDNYYVGGNGGDMDIQTEFTSNEITRMPASIQAAIGKGVLVLEEVE